MYEFEKTIPTLWGHVKDFMRLHPEHVAEGNAMDFQSGDGGETYNLCHFWSNFEIADMEFWRGAAYQDFFAYLEKQGISIVFSSFARSSSQAGSIMNDGATRLCIRLRRIFLRKRSSCTFSMI